MAPSREGPDHQRAHDDASNPFIAFRRFADEQMSNLMHTVLGVSSSSSPDRRVQDYQTWLREARESRDRLNRETEEADRIMDLYTKAHKEGQDPAQEEIQEAIQTDAKSMRCPYRPAEEDMPFAIARQRPWTSEDPRPSALAHSGTPLDYEAFSNPMLGLQSASLPIAYLLYSPYSPVKLEQQQALRDQDIDWREAFEDLVAAQKGQDMPSDSSHRPSETSAEWVRGMMGMLTRGRNEDKDEKLEALRAKTTEATKEIPNLCLLMCDTRQPESDAEEEEHRDNFEQDEEEEEEFTELDVYDRFLDREQPAASKATARSFTHLQHDSSPMEMDCRKPTILSTLTTTERTTLQDGTVHTKTVLKKRFADGCEVETETVHTQNAPSQGQAQQVSRNKDEDGKRQENTSKGWFWS